LQQVNTAETVRSILRSLSVRFGRELGDAQALKSTSDRQPIAFIEGCRRKHPDDGQTRRAAAKVASAAFPVVPVSSPNKQVSAATVRVFGARGDSADLNCFSVSIQEEMR
jgi:hypothetical protein